ncbi:MAG: ferrochelatase, partial [Bdellovibrionales bacterium]
CELAEKNAVKCYRSQCLVTSQRLAQALGLNPDQWSVSFQSRLGPVKWIQPYTDDRARKLAEQGVKRLAVFAPSFVVDGLETLEELAIELKDTFLEAGGVEYNYIPCLNSESHWVKGFAEHLKRELSET